jgi:hypothetical protein
MLKPIGGKQYEYWIYICPKEISFSSKQAIKRLRDCANSNTVSWGIITLDESSIIDLLIKSIMNEEQLLPSEVAKQVLDVVIINSHSQNQLDELSSSSVKSQYEEH